MSLRHPIRAWMVSALLLPPLLTPLPVKAGPPRLETPGLIAQASQGGKQQMPAEVLQWRQQIQT